MSSFLRLPHAQLPGRSEVEMSVHNEISSVASLFAPFPSGLVGFPWPDSLQERQRVHCGKGSRVGGERRRAKLATFQEVGC